jgi:hypothetical protein
MKAWKVQIGSLSEEWDLEVKQKADRYRLIVIRSKFKGVRTEPKVWHAETTNETGMKEMETFFFAALEKPHQPKQITINDGTLFTIRHIDNGKESQIVISNFEAQTNEYWFIEKLFDLCLNSINHTQVQSLTNRWKEQIP